MKSLRTSRRVAAVFVIAAVAVGIAGSAGTGRAAPGIALTFEPLLGTNGNAIPQVTYGKGIGFHLVIQNNGTNSTPQTSSVVVTSSSATYDSSLGGAAATFNGTPVPCSAPSDPKQMVCQLPTGKLNPGDTFEAFFRFIAPTDTTIKQVSTTAALSTTAQTVGGGKNNGSTLASGKLLTNLVSDVQIDNAYLRHDETASTVAPLTANNPQNFSLSTPATLLNNAFGVAVGITNTKGTATAPCPGSLGACTILTVPAAKFAESPPGTIFPGNPFYNGTANPYTWAMDATYNQGFTLTGVIHVDDNGVPQQVPSCASLALADPVGNPTGNPTAANPLCWDHLTQDKPNKLLHADGRGIENGNIGFGG